MSSEANQVKGNDEFIRSINDFQVYDDKSIVDKIMKFAEMDYLKFAGNFKNRRQVQLNFRLPEKYIAYRIRAFRERKLNRFNNLRRGFYKEWLLLEDILWYIERLREHYPRIPSTNLMTFYNIYKGIYKPKCYFYEEDSRILESAEYVSDCDISVEFQNDDFRGYDYTRLKAFNDKLSNTTKKHISPVKYYRNLINKYDKLSPVLRSKMKLLESLVSLFYNIEIAIQENKQIAKSKYDLWAITALENSLRMVDLNYENKQIVKYINKVWLTRFLKFCLEEEGLKRKQIRIDKTIRSLYIPIGENLIKWLPPAEDMIFDQNVKSFGLSFIKPLLTKSQMELVEEIVRIVEKDRAETNFSGYKLSLEHNNKVTARINKRHLANRLNMEESNLKHKLARINKKINKNWIGLIKSHLDKFGPPRGRYFPQNGKD